MAIAELEPLATGWGGPAQPPAAHRTGKHRVPERARGGGVASGRGGGALEKGRNLSAGGGPARGGKEQSKQGRAFNRGVKPAPTGGANEEARGQ